MPDFALHQQRQRLVAHARRSPRAIGNVDRIHAHRLQKARTLDFLCGCRFPWAERSPPWSQIRRAPASRPASDRSSRGTAGAALRGCALEHLSGGWLCREPRPRASADFITRMCSGVVPQHPPTSAHARRDKLARITRHVLRRAEINISALDRARHAGIRLRGQRQGSQRTHALHGVQHCHRTDAAIAADDVRAPLFQPWGKGFRVEPSRQLPSSSMVTCATRGIFGLDIPRGQHRLVKLFQIAESFEDEQIDSAFDQRLDLLAKSLRALPRTKFCPAVRFGSQRANRSRHPHIEALSGFAGQPRPRQVDVTHLVRQLCRARRKALAPKVLVSIISAPACRYSWWMPRIRSGCERFSSS